MEPWPAQSEMVNFELYTKLPSFPMRSPCDICLPHQPAVMFSLACPRTPKEGSSNLDNYTQNKYFFINSFINQLILFTLFQFSLNVIFFTGTLALMMETNLPTAKLVTSKVRSMTSLNMQNIKGSGDRNVSFYLRRKTLALTPPVYKYNSSLCY